MSKKWFWLLLVAVSCIAIGAVLFFSKYRTAKVMIIPIEEVAEDDYPEDPSDHSRRYGLYNARHLRLVKRDDTHFDFIFESDNPAVATVIFRNINLKLFIPIIPSWVKEDPNLVTIALVDREWNRQQVSFHPDSKHLEISGGDGFEKKNLISAELSRNCLNAGLWEVLFFNEEMGEKTLYYQGWFTFPLGHYKTLFEEQNNISYWKYWYRLEHWFSPEGIPIALNKLRTVLKEETVRFSFDPEEPIVLANEQVRKVKAMNSEGIHCWGDLCRQERQMKFASFLPPGRYNKNTPWNDQLDRVVHLQKAVHRKVICPAANTPLDEIELTFSNAEGDEQLHFIVSGIKLDNLPKLSTDQYSKGLYMPMGIGVGPFYESIDTLSVNPPYASPYFSLLLDSEGNWIDHHRVGIDGPVMHWDQFNPQKLHVYLLSYERHTLVGHYVLEIDEP